MIDGFNPNVLHFPQHLAKPSPVEFLQRGRLKSLEEILQHDPATYTEVCSLEATVVHRSPLLKTEARGLNKVCRYKGFAKTAYKDRMKTTGTSKDDMPCRVFGTSLEDVCPGPFSKSAKSGAEASFD